MASELRKHEQDTKLLRGDNISAASHKARRIKTTIALSVLLYATLIYAVSSESDFTVRAFGASTFGVPTPYIVAAVITLLYLPVPWFAWHGMEILLCGRALGMPHHGKLGVLYTLLTIGDRVPELRRSQLIAIGGFLYFAGGRRSGSFMRPHAAYDWEASTANAFPKAISEKRKHILL